MSSPIRVLLVDDDPLVRAGLTLLLGSSEDVEVVGEAGDGDAVAEAVRDHGPHVVLMDLRMPRMDGVAATEALRRMPAPPHVIVLTTWDVDEAVVRSVQAGASGYLLKSSSADEILGAIRAVMAGDAVLSPRSTRQLLDQWRQRDAGEARDRARGAMGTLTDRERDIARAVAEGLTNAEIGSRLYLADATVKSHLASIQTKLGVRNRVLVAVLAERAGLTA